METQPLPFGWTLNYILKIREIYMAFYERKYLYIFFCIFKKGDSAYGKKHKIRKWFPR